MSIPKFDLDTFIRLIEQIVNNTQVGLVVADARLPDLPLTYVSRAFQKITGYTEEEVIGKNALFLHGSDTAQPALAELRAALREGRPHHAALRNYRKNGEMFYNLLTVLPLFDEQHTLTHFIGIQQEVADLKHAEEDLHNIHAAYNARLQVISHELRNPLQAIAIVVDLLEKQPHTPSDAVFHRRISSLKRAVQHMADIISKVLRQQPEEISLDLEKVNFCLKLEVVVDQYAEVAAQKQITIHLDMPSEHCFVRADHIAIIEVLDNLISNAIKYSPPNKTVHIRTTTTGQLVRCDIADEGQGFSEEDKKHLFQPFAKLSAKPTGGEPSTGLGLSIVKRLMDKMNGSIRCESEFGKGATMIIELPIWREGL